MKIRKSSSLRKSRPKNVKIAIVMSRFNEVISRALLDGAKRGLQESGVPEEAVRVIEVPGAFEIPFAALQAARSRRYNGIICLGAVVRGETPHFDYVCLGTTHGIMNAQLETGVPMAFGVLTTDSLEQAATRSGRDENNKGFEAAKVVLEMVGLAGALKKKV
jgi:6,7-dimethyl-8-ribityllumazine synthase